MHLICAFVFAYVKIRFTHDAVKFSLLIELYSVLLASNHLDKKETFWIASKKYEPRHEKTNVLVSDLVRHKPGCTATKDG